MIHVLPDGPTPCDISIVTAVYDVARYLPEFFASLEGQTDVDLARVEIIAVDDGSTDESLAVLHRYRDAFAARGILPLTVVSQENAGQGPARNAGTVLARGPWITFTDPDDSLDPGYLSAVLRFVEAHPDVDMVGTAYWIHDEVTGTVTDTHPLRKRFDAGDRVVDLDNTPDVFYGSANAAFFRRERVLAAGIEFDGRIRPNFEDGHFCVRYLLESPGRRLGLVAGARYLYRKRADNTSTMQRSLGMPEKYTVVPRLGYLDVLERAVAAQGRVPEWLQSLVVYELSWYVSIHSRPAAAASAATGEVATEFVGLLRRIRRYLDDEVIAAFDARWLESNWRHILLHGLREEPWHSEQAVLDRVDPDQGLARVLVRWTGAEPRIEYLLDGLAVEAAHTKVHSFVFFERTLLEERISWVPSRGQVSVRVDGRPVEMRPWFPAAATTAYDTAAADGRRAVPRQRSMSSTLEAARRTVVRATLPSRFDGAWVLMDRTDKADDNAERLFEYLRENRPDINAWFTISADAKDYERLRAGRHGDRVVAHGSLTWKRLMLSCAHLVSSHIDFRVHRTPELAALLGGARSPWRFSFLQHGVIKEDLSNWLNTKVLDLFVTSTPGEYESIAGDRTAYVHTSREVKLTGLPRFDRLRRIARSVPDAERDILLVAPTWRQWLAKPKANPGDPTELRDDFPESNYAQSWLGLLRSPELAAACEQAGLRIGFLPHPNVARASDLMGLPDHVVRLSYDSGNVQRLFATTAALVTDYSSMSFDIAYLDRPMVYFQFDLDEVMAGGHTGREGYFKYPEDGFGPVARTVDDAVTEVSAIVRSGCVPSPEHARRIEEAFPQRDGRCCERVVAAIEALDKPVPVVPARRPALV